MEEIFKELVRYYFVVKILDNYVPFAECMGIEEKHFYNDNQFHYKNSTGICKDCLRRYKEMM